MTNQREPSKLAAMPVETLNRIERGQQTPSTASIIKIDRALTRATRLNSPKSAKRRSAA